MTSDDRIEFPARRSDDTPSNLNTDRVLLAVYLLRHAEGRNPLDAAVEFLDTPFSQSTEDIAQRFGVRVEHLRLMTRAVTVLRFHNLDAKTIEAFGSLPYSDGAVTIIAAAGLSRGEISSLVRQQTTADLSALAVLAGLRGYVLPAPDASGAPELTAAPPQTAGVDW